ncbi:LppU/SCO3897 family protein [Streptoalloteichus tenebrarius]
MSVTPPQPDQDGPGAAPGPTSGSSAPPGVGPVPMPPVPMPPMPPPPPPPPPAKRRTALWVGLGVGAVLLVGAVVAAGLATARAMEAADREASASSTAPARNAAGKRPAVGDCVDIVNPGDDASLRHFPCDSPQARLKVAKVLDSSADRCPDEDYSEYWERRPLGRGFKACMTLNLVEGACYHVSDGVRDDSDVERVPCDGGRADVRVVKVLPVADRAACGDGTALTYVEPPTTYCMAEVR